ncbi:DUF354 domain-containing protein [Candidatus Nitrosotenuis uzonensis]|uniref:DUF354 domain-containing protein n=1 Tax=Candidatus Nitrosotenuis uzonensis TaxID=1407055 RepID=UPI00064E3C9A|nr:DUF354 domain-containing protein [Candidatus Nitrosotenuis uzonensis]
MRIWFDILTPKQVLFFEPMIKRLQKNNRILCTSRNYREVVALARLKGMKMEFVGRHGGADKATKLTASLNRMITLAERIQRFGPDLTISFCSPEASRISYGLGIRHVAFCDSPHAEAVMRLSVPLVQKLLIPWIIPKEEFVRFGIAKKDIIPYKAIDAAVIVRNAKKSRYRGKRKKAILIRIEEEQAAYAKSDYKKISDIINRIANEFTDEDVVVLPRYKQQVSVLKREFGSKIKILDKVTIGSDLLQNTDVFVGSGGTMTAEAALFGIHTISYNAVPNLVLNYLVRKKLVHLQPDPAKITNLVARLLHSDKDTVRARAKNTLMSMEDPIEKLNGIIKSK